MATNFRPIYKALSNLRKDISNPKQHLGKVEISIRKYIRDMFENSKDPYDNPWKPTKRRNKILIDTGRLRRSYNFRVEKNSIIVENVAPYAGYVNKERKIIPGSKLPRKWNREINKQITGSIVRKFNKGK